MVCCWNFPRLKHCRKKKKKPLVLLASVRNQLVLFRGGGCMNSASLRGLDLWSANVKLAVDGL